MNSKNLGVISMNYFKSMVMEDISQVIAKENTDIILEDQFF